MPKKPKPTDNDLRTTWTKEADALTYEEAFQALDLLLVKLQDDSLPLADLQSSHQRAEIYLQRCQALLNEVEQSVLTLDPDTLETQPFEQQQDA